MDKEKHTKEEKFGLNSYFQFGTYNMSFIGTVIVEYIHDRIKHTESSETSKSAEA